MYNECEEMAKQAYEAAYLDAYEEMAKQAYEDAYADAYDEVCDAIAKQAEAAEFDDMVKMAYDEICGFEKEALWVDSWKQDPVQKHVVERLRSDSTRADSTLKALSKGIGNLKNRAVETGDQLRALNRAKESAALNARSFGEKASNRLKDLSSKHEKLTAQYRSANNMRNAIEAAYGIHR